MGLLTGKLIKLDVYTIPATPHHDIFLDHTNSLCYVTVDGKLRPTVYHDHPRLPEVLKVVFKKVIQSDTTLLAQLAEYPQKNSVSVVKEKILEMYDFDLKTLSDKVVEQLMYSAAT